jgi:hypothetical protein
MHDSSIEIVGQGLRLPTVKKNDGGAEAYPGILRRDWPSRRFDQPA